MIDDSLVNSSTDANPFNVVLCTGDISHDFYMRLRAESVLGIDIETSGLDFRVGSIGSIQVFDGLSSICIVRPPFANPRRLKRLMAAKKFQKVFHHAMFDLRFLRHHLGVTPRSVSCTKVAAKILFPELQSHSLKDLVARQLGISLDKSEQVSNWLSADLSQRQLDYAVRDVVYLPRLLASLLAQSDNQAARKLIQASFDYLPVRVELDLMRVGDVFVY